MEKLRTEGLTHSLRTQMFQLPETPTLCLTVSELTRFTHTGVRGPGPTGIPKLFTDGIHSHFSRNTHAHPPTPPQFHRLKHTHVRSPAEVYDDPKEEKELVTVQDSCSSRGPGGHVLPTHTGPALPTQAGR